MDQKANKKNEDKLTELKEKAEEFENNWKRALADYKNLEKRTNEEKKMLVEFANSVLIERLLPVLDNFEMIEKHSDDVGIKLTIKELQQILESSGLENVIPEKGAKFDPQTMDAVETVSGEKDKVIEIIRKGYFYKSKLIRPVSVKVGSGNEEDAAAEMEKNQNE